MSPPTLFSFSKVTLIILFIYFILPLQVKFKIDLFQHLLSQRLCAQHTGDGAWKHWVNRSPHLNLQARLDEGERPLTWCNDKGPVTRGTLPKVTVIIKL